MSHFHSSGRGGAGNIVDSAKSPQIKPEDLQTPTLKTSMVTTGRGGTGNFASGLDADEKRRRQDVVPVVRRDSHGATHIGRGGTGNVVKTGAEGDSSAGAGSPPLSATAAASDRPPTPIMDQLRKVKSATTDKLRREKSASPPAPAGGDDDDVAVPARKPEEIGWAEKGRNLLFGKK